MKKVLIFVHLVFGSLQHIQTKSKNFQSGDIHYIYGRKDEFLTNDILIEMKSKIKKSGFNPNIESFNGSHEINKEKISQIIIKP